MRTAYSMFIYKNDYEDPIPNVRLNDASLFVIFNDILISSNLVLCYRYQRYSINISNIINIK